MAPDSIGTWWCEDTKRQCDNLTTQLYEVEEVKKLIWVFCTPTHYESLKCNALEIYLEAFECNRAEDIR